VQISVNIPASLKSALEEKAGTSGGVSASPRHLPATEKPIHTIFQVSTSGALVASVYDSEVNGPIDYVKYAEACGAHGTMIKTPDEIDPVIKRAFDTAGPVIVGVHVDYSDNHFEMVRGDNIH
jgi:hypothetical protein